MKALVVALLVLASPGWIFPQGLRRCLCSGSILAAMEEVEAEGCACCETEDEAPPAAPPREALRPLPRTDCCVVLLLESHSSETTSPPIDHADILIEGLLGSDLIAPPIDATEATSFERCSRPRPRPPPRPLPLRI